jgi:hypothetical protein
MVCRSGRSGLGDRDGLACGAGGGGIEGGSGSGSGSLGVGEWDIEGSLTRLDLLFLLPNTACSEEVRGCSEGRGGSVGLESSGYVIAGIVPPPMNPFPRSWSDESEDKVRLPPEEEGLGWVTPSSRDMRSASRRSMRSLH